MRRSRRSPAISWPGRWRLCDAISKRRLFWPGRRVCIARGAKKWKQLCPLRKVVEVCPGSARCGYFVSGDRGRASRSRQSASVSFAGTGAADQAPFPSITERSRFVCTRCGNRAVSIVPDWSNHRATVYDGRAERVWAFPRALQHRGRVADEPEIECIQRKAAASQWRELPNENARRTSTPGESKRLRAVE
jgi:hypothetical protein